MSRPTIRTARNKGCPVCGTPATPAQNPFCSQGCRDRDLLNWLGDAYRSPGPPAGDDALENHAGGLDMPGRRPL